VRKKLLVLGVAALGVLGIVAIAHAAIIQSLVIKSSPAKAGKPTSFDVKYGTQLTADDPGYKVKGQPPPPTALTLRIVKGGKYNGKFFAKCNLAKLQTQGPKGCPSKSKIGSGIGIGSAKPIVTQDVRGKLTIFNGGANKIYVFVLPDLGPTFVVVGTLKKTSGKFGYDLTFKIPPIKTLPSAPDAAVISVDTKTPIKTIKKAGKKIGYVVAPKKCKGTWPYEGTFTFTDGQSVTVKGTTKCKK
jgi:hypothetical protein